MKLFPIRFSKIILCAVCGLLALFLLAGCSIEIRLPELFPDILPDIPADPPKTEEAELTFNMPEGRPLRIAQFADLHFGDGVSIYHNTFEERTKAFMAYIVESGKPDLIVCSGDQVMSYNVPQIKEFVAMMDSLETPWVFVWGNHDAEGSAFGYTKREVSAALAASDSPYLLYAEGYTERGEEDRYGNFSIRLLDHAGEKTVGALMFLDSGTYDYEKEAYQEVTKGQVEWYRSEVDRLQEIYASENSGGGIIPSMVFAHMPLPDITAACLKAEAGEGAEFVIRDGRYFGTGSTEDYVASPIFAAMVEKVSAKAYLFAHYHIAKYQVRMDGILLGFAPQTGFSHSGYVSRRNTYIYSIDEEFNITTENFLEQTGD